MAGLTIFTAASLACALATADTFLIVMRGLQGLGAAVVLPAALSIVMNMFSEGTERNKALGIWGGAAGATAGLLAGGVPTVAATRTQALLGQGHATAVALTGGFQLALWVSGLTGLAAVPVTFLLIRRRELARAALRSNRPYSRS
jgi:MFS family permease